jgi:hypothetical protein
MPWRPSGAGAYMPFHFETAGMNNKVGRQNNQMAVFITPLMEAIRSSETSTRCSIPEDSHLYTLRHVFLRSRQGENAFFTLLLFPNRRLGVYLFP